MTSILCNIFFFKALVYFVLYFQVSCSFPYFYIMHSNQFDVTFCWFQNEVQDLSRENASQMLSVSMAFQPILECT